MTNPKRTLKVRLDAIVRDAIERGVGLGYRRAFRFTDTPGEDAIRRAIVDAVMLELGDVVDWGDEP